MQDYDTSEWGKYM